jgi:hypothetical protein
MNETVANEIPVPVDAPATPKPPVHSSQKTFAWYCGLAAFVVAGWLLRDQEFINPEEGLGYWLGIVGGTLMLLLLFYPMGKKSQLLRRLGLLKHWFRIHMIFGLIGPLLILYHSNFRVDAINSKVAFYSMLAVAISGIIGRYFYTRIHRGLYGKRASIEELRNELAETHEGTGGLATLLPRFSRDIHDLSGELLGDEYTRTISVGRSLVWTVKHYFVRARLYLRVKRELRAQAMVSETIRDNLKDIQRTANNYARDQVSLIRKVAQLSFYERLFSLWHILHMPLFLLLIISALVHVLAVHMY